MLAREESTNKSSFNVYIDLFNKGEFSELKVIREKEQYAVLLEDYKLATIQKDGENRWVKLDGNMPSEKLEQVGDIINIRLHDRKRQHN